MIFIIKEYGDEVIVTDVRYRMSLPIIRSLGKAGKKVICTELETTPKKSALGAYSKHATALERTPAPTDEGFLARLRELSGDKNPVIMPVGIDSLFTLSKHQEEVSSFARTALPRHDMLSLANDKNALISHAQQVGIPCPETTQQRDGESMDELLARLSFPLVVKYREGELLRLNPEDRYAIIKSPEEFPKIYSAMHEKQSFPIIQSYVEGDGYGVSCVFDQAHNPLAVFCHHRLREYPISGGPSCLCESIWNDDLANYAVKLLKSLEWTGVAMVEFKGSPEAGFKLMEINPRFWGSLALAPIAGCDIAAALYDAASGELAESSTTLKPSYKLNKKMHFFLQDALSVLAYSKKAPSRLAYLLKNIWSILSPSVRGGVFSISDPIPGFRYFLNALKKTDKIIR